MKNIFVLFVSRIIKVFANITKLLCYVFHFLFPNRRFTIPAQSAPLYKTDSNPRISKTLWQTNFTNRATLPVYLNYLFNRLLSPTFEYRFMITADRADFIKKNYSADIFDSYSKLQIGAAQADLWRLLVLQKQGGVYMDIDAHLVWPINRIIKPDYNELYITTKNGEISNYFIASQKDNPHLEAMINLVLKNIQENSIKNIYDLTGPGVFNQILDKNAVHTSLYRHTCNQGNFTNEYFQYIDKPEGKWTKAQKTIDVIKKGNPSS